MDAATDYLYSWNFANKERLARVKVEDDIRDALQYIRAVQPSLAKRQELLDLSARLGVQYSFLGFPAASERELELVVSLVQYISREKLDLAAVVMARAVRSDILEIASVQEKTGFPVAADVFIGTSALRMKVEGWTLQDVMDKIRESINVARDNDVELRVSLEDSARAEPANLRRLVTQIVGEGVKTLVLCDTAGDCLPSGAACITSFVDEIVSNEGLHVEIGWHGHNDKGLGLANALAAAEAGATIISGTFTGIGERTGNIPLEQVIYVLAKAGSPLYDLRYLKPLCDVMASACKVELPFNSPIVGRDAFSTSTGTHAAALYKAREFGRDYEDLMYSAVAAVDLGRQQTVLIGPNSGRRAVYEALNEMHIEPTEERLSAILEYCKSQDRCLDSAADIGEVLRSRSLQT